VQKEIENMNDHELLEELVRQGRRRERAEQIKICAIAVLLLTVVILAAVYIPKILAPMRQISQSMQQVEQTAEEARRVLSNFDEKTVDQIKQTMESLNETSQQIRVLTDKLRDSGLDKLQSTLEGLNDSLGSFLRLFGR
jgi:methyl-accepting chemotaxis protein